MYPFSAIVALDKLKLAIIINAINPKIGGILIRGPKGSGKTTVVRGLINILPKIEAVKDCPFNCSPQDPSNMCYKCSTRYHKKQDLPMQERDMLVVNLPLGATEDRVVGSLNVEKAIKLGVEALKPGILAEANQNILYVDEVNLLPDHIADDLLDAAATGWNVVEREGISVSHPSRFIFIGTMNPEEGELRPQLLDRFPLSAEVEKISSVKDRMEIVKRNIGFEEDPEKFREKFRAVQEELRDRIIRARNILPKVQTPEGLLEAICQTCLDLKVDGMRPDIVIDKAARTLAAFENRLKVTQDDVLVASELALGHRTRESGFVDPATPEEISKIFMARVKEVRYLEETKSSETKDDEKRKKARGRTMIWAKDDASEKEEAAVEKRRSKLRARFFQFLSMLTPVFGFGKRLKKNPKDAPVTDGVTKGSDKLRGKTQKEPVPEKGDKAIPTISSALRPPQLAEGISLLTRIKGSVLKPFRLLFKSKRTIKRVSSSAGKRATTVTTLHRGRSFGWKLPHGRAKDVHLVATIRAAARKQKERGKPLKTALKICMEDVREKVRLYKAPMTIMFIIDLSGSMLFSIKEVKEAILKLHKDAYRYRDKVGIVALKETGAVIVQHPITNLRVVANKLLGLKVSGFTPLAAGMLKAWEVLKEAKRRDQSTIPVMVIITDGSANVPLQKSLETGEIREFNAIGIAVREFEDLAVGDVVSVAKMISKERIHMVVVNTNPHFYGRETYGFTVTRRIASMTNGSHHEVGKLAREEELVERIFERLAEDQRMIAHQTSLSLNSP
ncbi:MAG: VWA domain-containing protein [Candidatus Bathyarchaeota archaeon]|nr:MAG: VWA domain-containing protein [Candidatus Bathyarchaeota archaeon]